MLGKLSRTFLAVSSKSPDSRLQATAIIPLTYTLLPQMKIKLSCEHEISTVSLILESTILIMVCKHLISCMIVHLSP